MPCYNQMLDLIEMLNKITVNEAYRLKGNVILGYTANMLNKKLLAPGEEYFAILV